MPRISKVASAAADTIALTVPAERGVSEIVGLAINGVTTGGSTGDARLTVKSAATEIWESTDLVGATEFESLFPFVSLQPGQDLIVGFKTSGDRTLTGGELLVTIQL
jgi:hypothetical protein